jgi:hypothetical protein
VLSAIYITLLIFNEESTSLYPGYEIICSIQADLEAAFIAAPTLRAKDGRKYREVMVS